MRSAELSAGRYFGISKRRVIITDGNYSVRFYLTTILFNDIMGKVLKTFNVLGDVNFESYCKSKIQGRIMYHNFGILLCVYECVRKAFGRPSERSKKLFQKPCSILLCADNSYSLKRKDKRY